MPYASPRGTQDILPSETPRWRRLEAAFLSLSGRFGYQEIRTPIFENTELFTRSVGEETDIVTKQMYTFRTPGDDSLTLRPEGTAPVLRAAIQHGMLSVGGTVKLSYSGPIFRYERPAKGRFRQFHQVGVEALGSAEPEMDAELLQLADEFLRTVGVVGATLELNSVGCPVCRPRYREALRAALASVHEELCEDCQRRYETNPMRILDCKVPTCRELSQRVPVILDTLCDECRDHLAGVEHSLIALGISHVINPHIVRGLDYYTRTAFEFTHDRGLGAQKTVLAGGRYDGLVKALGGPDTPGIGFAAGVERLLLAGEENEAPISANPLVFFAAEGPEAHARIYQLIAEARRTGITAVMDFGVRSLKAQMRSADRLGATSVVLIRDVEMASGMALLRDMATATQQEVHQTELVTLLGRTATPTCP